MSYFPLALRLLFFVMLALLLDGAASFLLAHHCGPSQPLPEFPRHSCRTHTQTWQPGETVDNHPGGAKGRGTAPAQGTGSNQSVHCQLINNKCVCGSIGYTGRNIPCRPDVQAKPLPTSCPAYQSPAATGGTSRQRPGNLSRYATNQVNPQQTWEGQLRDDITTEVERRANGQSGFDRRKTEVKVTLDGLGGYQRGAVRGNVSPQYVALADQVLSEFYDSNRLIPPQGQRNLTLTLVLGETQSPSQPPASPPPTSPSPSAPSADNPPSGQLPPFQLGATWESNLVNDIKCEVERRARPPLNANFTKIDIQVNPSGNPSWNVSPETPNYSPDYWRLADQVLKEFAKQGRLRPQDGQAHNMTLVLGIEQSSYPPPQAVTPPQQPPPQRQEPAVPAVPLGASTGSGEYNGYGFAIKIGDAVQPNPRKYLEGPLEPGLQGRYYTRFGGYLVQKWVSNTQPGSFLVTRLFVGNSYYDVNIPVNLYKQ
jgi:hypothetical protein